VNHILIPAGIPSDSIRPSDALVYPDVRFSGVSRALLKALEARARKRGAILCRLESTETARRFYRSNGYVETGAATGKFGARSGYRMTKSLL
jgi:GNAT superfamily N-acetyltransferase